MCTSRTKQIWSFFPSKSNLFSSCYRWKHYYIGIKQQPLTYALNNISVISWLSWSNTGVRRENSIDLPYIRTVINGLNIHYIDETKVAVVNIKVKNDNYWIRVITKLPNTEQSSKGKVKTHKSTNRQNQSTTGKLGNRNGPDLV